MTAGPFKTLRAAKAFNKKLEKAGNWSGDVRLEEGRQGYGQRGRKYWVWYTEQRNAAPRGIAGAVKTLLKKVNPSAKISGAHVVRLKGGVLKITPIKANRARSKR